MDEEKKNIKVDNDRKQKTDSLKPVNQYLNLEDDEVTELQEEIEEKIANDEATLEGEALSGELSKDRTHMSEHRTRMSEHRTALSDKRTALSYQRTALSYERTLMSWVRTSASLITFGFSIYKIFEEIQKSNTRPTVLTPRAVGLIMIGFGFLGLLFAEIQHVKSYKELKKDFPELKISLTSILAILILFFGLFLFLAALFRQ